MGKGRQVTLVMILATSVMLGLAQLELRPGRNPDVALLYARPRNTPVVVLAADVNCTTEGASVVNCTTYRVCVNVTNAGLVGATYTCPAGENLDPNTYNCSSSYACPTPCTGRNFTCPTNTTYNLCTSTGVEYANNSPCPPGYYCNKVCSTQCVNSVPAC